MSNILLHPTHPFRRMRKCAEDAERHRAMWSEIMGFEIPAEGGGPVLDDYGRRIRTRRRRSTRAAR
jgi:hypothetical protein